MSGGQLLHGEGTIIKIYLPLFNVNETSQFVQIPRDNIIIKVSYALCLDRRGNAMREREWSDRDHKIVSQIQKWQKL